VIAGIIYDRRHHALILASCVVAGIVRCRWHCPSLLAWPVIAGTVCGGIAVDRWRRIITEIALPRVATVIARRRDSLQSCAVAGIVHCCWHRPPSPMIIGTVRCY